MWVWVLGRIVAELVAAVETFSWRLAPDATPCTDNEQKTIAEPMDLINAFGGAFEIRTPRDAANTRCARHSVAGLAVGRRRADHGVGLWVAGKELDLIRYRAIAHPGSASSTSSPRRLSHR